MHGTINGTIENEYPYYRMAESESLSPGMDSNKAEFEFSQTSASDFSMQDQETFTTAANQYSTWFNESNNTSIETVSETNKFMDNQRRNFIELHKVDHIDTKGPSDKSDVSINIRELQRVRSHSERSYESSQYKCNQKQFAVRRYSESSIESLELEIPKQVTVEVEVHRTCNSPNLKLPARLIQTKVENLSTKQNRETYIASRNHLPAPHRRYSESEMSNAASNFDLPRLVDEPIEYEHKVEEPTIKKTKREQRKQAKDPSLTEYLAKTSRRRFAKECCPRLFCGWKYNWNLHEVHYNSAWYKVPRWMEVSWNILRISYICIYVCFILLGLLILFITGLLVENWIMTSRTF